MNAKKGKLSLLEAQPKYVPSDQRPKLLDTVTAKYVPNSQRPQL
jgi:hypothetical protein